MRIDGAYAAAHALSPGVHTLSVEGRVCGAELTPGFAAGFLLSSFGLDDLGGGVEWSARGTENLGVWNSTANPAFSSQFAGVRSNDHRSIIDDTLFHLPGDWDAKFAAVGAGEFSFLASGQFTWDGTATTLRLTARRDSQSIAALADGLLRGRLPDSAVGDATHLFLPGQTRFLWPRGPFVEDWAPRAGPPPAAAEAPASPSRVEPPSIPLPPRQGEPTRPPEGSPIVAPSYPSIDLPPDVAVEPAAPFVPSDPPPPIGEQAGFVPIAVPPTYVGLDVPIELPMPGNWFYFDFDDRLEQLGDISSLITRFDRDLLAYDVGVDAAEPRLMIASLDASPFYAFAQDHAGASPAVPEPAELITAVVAFAAASLGRRMSRSSRSLLSA
jgi:hypothetical protein